MSMITCVFCECGSNNQITKHFGPCIGSPKMNINTKCKHSPDDCTKCSSVRSELVHIWFQCTKFITHVAYQLNLWQSNTTQATVPSRCIQALPFGTFLCSNFQPKYVFVYRMCCLLFILAKTSRHNYSTVQFTGPDSLPPRAPTASNT